MLCGKAEKSLTRTRNSYTVDSRRSATTNSERHYSLCYSSTPRPVSSMSVEAELIRTQSVNTMPSPPVPFQRMLRAQTSYPVRPPLHKERWHGGQVKAHLSAIGGPQGPLTSGSKSQGTEWRRLQRHHVEARTAQLGHSFTRIFRDHDRRCRVVLNH